MSNDTRQAIYPTMRYDDPDKALEFMTGTLGLSEHMVYRDGDTIVHAQMEWDGDLVMFGPSVKGDLYDLGPICLYLAIADPDAHHDKVVAAGGEIVMPLTDQDYGSREFTVRDFQGHLWCFGTYRPSPSDPPH